MKVDKAQFDALPKRMMDTRPEPLKSIKTTGKAGKIIPAAGEKRRFSYGIGPRVEHIRCAYSILKDLIGQTLRLLPKIRFDRERDI